MSTMALSVVFLISLCHFSLLAYAQNNFIFPPDGGIHGVIVGDANLTLEIGETVELKWATNSTSPIRLVVFQGPRDPERTLDSLTLIDGAADPVPTSYVWTVTSVSENNPYLRLSPVHFLVFFNDGTGFNSKYVRLRAASGSSTPSSGFDSVPGRTTSDSSPPVSNPQSSDDKLSLGLGLGLGISGAFVIGGIVGFFMRRRKKATQPTLNTGALTTVQGREVKSTLIGRQMGKMQNSAQHEAEGVPVSELP